MDTKVCVVAFRAPLTLMEQLSVDATDVVKVKVDEDDIGDVCSALLGATILGGLSRTDF